MDINGGRIIKVSPNDSASWWKKCEEIRDIIDQDLGFAENSKKIKDQSTVFLYVIDRQVAGCLIVEFISKAYRIMPQKSVTNENGNKLVCCSDESEKVTVGISRIWVAHSYRRKGIATRLVNTMKCNVYSHHFLSVDEFAFSDPTESGLKFGRKCTGKNNFLVYRHS